LVVQLQSKLDLARIIWIVARRSNFAEVRVSEVARTADRHYAVAAEVGRVEVGMVENVEHLGAELHREPLSNRELLEYREVEAMETGAGGKGGFGSQGGRAIERNTARR